MKNIKPSKVNAINWYNTHLQIIKKYGEHNSPLAKKYKTWCFKHRILGNY